MRTAVTGAAGFIGAALCRFLIQRGDEVLGIDSFLDSYPREIKEDRLADLLAQERFRFVEADLIVGELTELIADIDCVFHLAAQAGVRTSWGGRFAAYADNNILATQRLLEAAEATGVGRLVYASSSAVYGDAAIPTPEDAPLNPLSPYAVSKLAGEQLCALYGVPTVVLRFFTVYGPKPRPDQAVCIFTRALLEGRAIRILGDGEQLRGMSYVDDVAAAILVAAERDCEGEILNVGGPDGITVNQLVGQLEEITGERARREYVGQAKGDARHTLADIARAERLLGWRPATSVAAGLERTVASIRAYYRSGGGD